MLSCKDVGNYLSVALIEIMLFNIFVEIKSSNKCCGSHIPKFKELFMLNVLQVC